MKFKLFITKPCVLILISAVLSALPLTFSSLFWLSWVSFAPFFYVIIKHSDDKLIRSLARGILFGIIYHVCIYYWFLEFCTPDYTGVTKIARIGFVTLCWLGISAVHGVLWCIPTVLSCLVAKKVKNPYLLCAVAVLGIIAAENLTQISELSFPWARVSLGLYSVPQLIQSASLFGIDGVDILILSVNSLLALSIVGTHKKRIAALSAAVAVFCVNLGFGFVRINTENNSGEINILTVQASVETSQKWSADGDKICYDIYSSLTKQNITADTDLIIWPESAVPKVYKSEKSLGKYTKISKELDTPLLVGILRKTDGIYTNNAALIDENGITDCYAKRQLVPFGEYMPYKRILSKVFPFLDNLNIVDEDCTAGTDTAVMKVKGGKIGNIICFESTYPDLYRQSVSDGAELIIEVTNDSWLGDSPAMRQHLAHGVFRSIENGRYLVRSANSGVSAVIDSRGRVLKALDPNVQGVICDTVYFSNESTLYTKTGDIIFPILALAVIIWYLVLLIASFNQKKNVP